MIFVPILFYYVGVASAANILALLSTVSRSHHIWNSPLLETLAGRGHNVTVLSPEARKHPIPNLTDLVLTGIFDRKEEFNDGWTPDIMVQSSMTQAFHGFMQFFGTMCEMALNTDGMKTLMDYPEDMKFDLAIVETTGGECFLGILQKFGLPPVIGVSAFTSPQWIHDYVGNPHHPAYIPNIFLPHSHRMTFLQRARNTLLNIYINYEWHFNYLPAMNALSRRQFGPASPLPTQILHNMSVLLASVHPVFDYPRPEVPGLISVAGIHIKEPQILPKNIQVFLDEATEGAILFSLGSNLRADAIAEDKLQAILDAFKELPQRVLWKWDADQLPDQPKNVKISKWLQQSDILAHPNVRLFITHSGLLSTQEAIYRAVPVIGIPFYADQYINIHKMIDHGVGLKLEYREITKQSVSQAIHTVLYSERYKENMRQLSERFRDQPDTPLERALYWCEYVMRHKGAHHLRSAAMDLTWYQYFLLDVMLFIVVGSFTPIACLYWCWRKFMKKKGTVKNKQR